MGPPVNFRRDRNSTKYFCVKPYTKPSKSIMGKALILVGGFGTRLRPLTLTKPKPLVEFCNLPIVEHQIKALKEAGVNVVVLAVSYKPEDMADAIKEMEVKYDVKLVISHETEPLGTGAWYRTLPCTHSPVP